LGYVHNDIKPENILTDFKTIKLIDFGFAVKINQKRGLCGTPLY